MNDPMSTLPQSTPSPQQRALVTSAAAAFIQREDGRVLLVHHAGTKHWVMPGGKTDDGPKGGETPLQCCEREGREETGVPVQVGRLLVVQWLSSGSPGNYSNPRACHLFVFSATISPQHYDRIRVPEGELLGWDWWEPEAALTVMDRTNAPLLTAAVQAASGAQDAPLYLEDDQQPTGTQEVRR
ncbi:hypothetical protein C3486_26300 [Streptomyces sp. Ru73]|uniref:NUDIX domain-containing protein n=1 Tax=Streptomyces sp. Ru73 TaxID=2080748 RepID=UPI000CDDB46F|nr:NUDIX hydrolase [Streptomyces sp. Ru73]POX37860.1 hypothetical protein C3486_26300 [Streptomyces sp. Ru73]